jgi:hypothetical protein
MTFSLRPSKYNGPAQDYFRSARLVLIFSEALDSCMDFELYPTITLREGSFNVLVAPREMFIQALNKNLNLQRFKVLYVSGNNSGILSKLDRRFTELEVRRGFTVFQLMTILEEAHHSFIIVEHDPMLYEDAAEMVEYISHAMRDTSKDAAVLLYSPAVDPFLEDLIKDADRAFYFEDGPRAAPKIVAKALPKTQKDQTTLEAFS